MLYKEITAMEAMEIILTEAPQVLYFQQEARNPIYPLKGNSVYVVNVAKYKWFLECEECEH